VSKLFYKKISLFLVLLSLCGFLIACTNFAKKDDDGGKTPTPNIPSIIISGGASSVKVEESTPKFVATLYNYDGTSVPTYKWTVDPSQAGTFGNSNNAESVFTAGNQSYSSVKIEMTASVDGNLYKISKNISIVDKDNPIPNIPSIAISGGASSVKVGESTPKFVATLYNYDGTSVPTYKWTVDPSQAGTFGNSNNVESVFTAGSTSYPSVKIEMTASVDGQILNASKTISIIQDGQTPPPSLEVPNGPTSPSDPNIKSWQVSSDLWIPNSNTTPAAAKARFQRFLSREDFEILFPNRYGMGEWYPSNPATQPVFDYYSYDNLLTAAEVVANIVLIYGYRKNPDGTLNSYAPQTSVLHKNNGTKAYIMSQHPDFDVDWNINKPIQYQAIDFGEFLAHQLDNDNKREIATMLAHMTQETSGGEGVQGRIDKALWWNEETSYIWGWTDPGYVSTEDKTYPPTPGQSYHGRGPKQLSWNYNYGLFSDIFFLDKHVLLDNPSLLVQNGALGYMTAIAFYMTPQGKKASMHQVIDSNYKFDDQAYADSHGFKIGFGLTIIIINGGLEGGLTEADPRVGTRVGAYRNICRRNGANIDGEKLDTAGMSAWE